MLIGVSATRDKVLTELPLSTWVHFACHGYSNLANPSNSHLLMYDHHEQPLTVLTISRLRLAEAQLAFLSACSTARNSPNLPDEAIHITAALQIAGYPHVIGTLWNITDLSASQFAEQIYAQLTRGTVDTSRTALVVHHVARSFRNRYPQNPSLWAAHIYAGA